MLEYIREKFTRRSQPEEIQPWFAKEGELEKLIRQGRVPQFNPSEKTDAKSMKLVERVFVFIPPEGVDVRIDEYERRVGMGLEFFAPNGGPSKGMAALYEIDSKLGRELKAKKNEILEKMGLLTS